jgi:uncharacterized membrane protein
MLAQIPAMTLALLLGRALSNSQETDWLRFAAATVAALFGWSFGHGIIRWIHHRGFMDDNVPLLDLEGYAHALWPLVFVLVAAEITKRAPGRDATRAYLADLQSIWAAAVWPAFLYACLGFCLLYAPWWGAMPVQFYANTGAVIAFTAMLTAALTSWFAPDVPKVHWKLWLVRAATVAVAAQLFVALTMLVRWLHHGPDMATAPPGEVELWIYSAVWALFGAGALGLGLWRNDPVMRWVGLGVLLITTAKVFVVDTARLSGVIRAASFIGLGAVLMLATWAARRNRPPPQPGDLVTVAPSARRERRRVRRRTTS